MARHLFIPQVDGTLRFEPVDYDDLARVAQSLQDELREGAAQPVTVDVGSSSDEPPADGAAGALRSAAE